ncbi:MAG: hypothetical protein V2A58_10780 [Planctomycetota bacterium]
MPLERRLRILHLLVTAQFIAGAAIILFWSFHQTGLHGWAILSLSVPGLVLVLLAALIYGFAVARGVVGERIPDEHPLTGFAPYRLFYLVTPILGGLAGAAFYSFTEGATVAVRGAALGTILPACTIWLVLDPLLGIIESALPSTRRLRAARLARERDLRAARAQENERILAKVRADYRAHIEALRPLLLDRADRLSLLLRDPSPPQLRRRRADEAARLGFETWQTGGTDLMRELAALTLSRLDSPRRPELAATLDYLWDGVGDWREGSLYVEPFRVKPSA